MKKNLFVKLFTLFVFSMFCIIPVTAQNKQVVLSKILITPLQDNTYSLNLYFDNEFKGKTYFEKMNNGSYSIYLTHSELAPQKTKIYYQKNIDKRNIKIFLDQKPLTTKGKLTNYVTLDVRMNANYSLQVVPKKAGEDKMLFLTSSSSAIIPLTLLGIGLVLFLFLIRFLSTKAEKKDTNSFTQFPTNFYTNNLNYSRKVKYNRKSINNLLQKNSEKRTIRTMKKSSFKCFDIPVANRKNSGYSFQTNPIEKETLDIPFADEVINNAPRFDKYGSEIISSIDINRNKGFYLAIVDEMICLYGHINNNVFLLKQFRDLTQINLQARFYDNNKDSEIYIVRIDSYKAMVEVSKDSIRELVVL